MKTKPTGYWTFFCNPARWEIDEFLLSGEKFDNYLVTPWQAEWFRPGQFGIVRVGVDKRSKKQLRGKKRLEGGVYAIVQILSTAKVPTEKDYDNESDLYWMGKWVRAGRKIVNLKYVKNLIERPLLIREIQKSKSFADDYLIDGFEGSTMPLLASVFDAIVNRIGEPEDVLQDIDETIVRSSRQVRQLEEKYLNAPPVAKEAINKRIERGPLARRAKKLNGFRCMICESLAQNPIGFMKRDGEPYIEAHHVVPVSRLQIGSLGLPNLMTLCANHHRECHYGIVEFLPSDKNKFIVKIQGRVLEIPKLRL
jgi:hypothetical protein